MSEFREAVWAQVGEDAVPERFGLRRDFLLRHAGARRRVLDAGCGAGEFSAALLEAGAEVVAVDVAHEAVRRAERRVPGLDARVWPEGGALPLEDGAVDVVWAGEVLEHVVDVAAWLSELRRVLRPRGELLLTTPHHGPRLLLGLALSPRRFAAHFEPRADHLRFFSPATLRELLEDLGFAVADLRVRDGHILCRAGRP